MQSTLIFHSNPSYFFYCLTYSTTLLEILFAYHDYPTLQESLSIFFLADLQWNITCSTVSLPSPHIMQVSSTSMHLFLSLAPTRILSRHDLHIKCWIFFLICKFQIPLHNNCSSSPFLTLVSSSSLTFFSYSIAIL